ncbi:hypothetical protein L2719_19505 [Shewanella schlegeliana]|uniref:Membrane anchored protein in chemotaxis locus n=1 Tax=Shewanella schlegeliana TaxID=190308 RepID=A0ABS1STF8_9GAMM|nr:hypothetical protein [Shewanella schlegeliana]MBL4911605.1 hypothetical protein [Shewanella schlegeliana]MCL1111711.1 hypothetical protein [Shewanella schlegeliana]GIU36226.1 membrane anchored protein in chemotaxis locus [Shewanella schlegeliana]
MANGKLKLRLSQQRGAMNTLSLLVMFLLSIATFTFGSLYFEQLHKIKSLSAEVKQLKDSQVLLMVPDEQAEVMANWMANNPHFVQSFVDKAKQGESTVLPIGPGIQQTPTNQSQSAKGNHLQMSDSSDELDPESEPESRAQLSGAKVNSAPTGTLSQKSTIHKSQSEPMQNNKAMTNSKPEQTKSISKVVTNTSNRLPQKSVTLTETADGVKLISLPHGGIRVTTREPDK